MNSLKNTSYFFLPFVYNEHANFNALIEILDRSYIWRQVHDEVLYMLKYVADKIDSNNKKECQCFHYILNETIRERFGLANENEWFFTNPHTYHNEEESIKLQILNVHLYCFSTSVGIIAFKVHLGNDDPFWIANAQYYLKKVSREKLFLNFNVDPITMLDVSKELVHELSTISNIEFFYYANPSTERANVFSYITVAPKDNYKRELFYLRRCYSDGYIYAENEKLDADEIYIPSKDTVWGISPEAAVCLACPGLGREKFIQGTFFANFNAQYLFMYVLLLHQKYALYMFLTRIGIGSYNSLKTLEDYRHQLYEFETDFVFTCVTEVPQYQSFLQNKLKLAILQL